ncbi:MAG: helix-turn-helix domain-containing protein [Betaproteobacteria bacterium]|nr:helix-turn-helix domain-containing protein [Betaproteobacteria bacterium]
MSLDALSWAFNLDLPSSGAKLTLLALANFADEHGEAYPSQKAISVKTCLCERAIRAHLVTLENLGVITRISRKRANGSFTSDRFKIHIGAVLTGGGACQRQILPEAESLNNQRQILPAAHSADGRKRPQPAADSAGPETSLTTTVNTLLHTTELTGTTARESADPEERVCVDLIFPSVPEHIRSALMQIMEPCDPLAKQPILDELSGALSSGTCRNPVTFTRSLVKAAMHGAFYPSLGVEVARKRAQAAAREKAMATAPAPSDPVARRKGQEFIETIRERRKRDPRSGGEEKPEIRASG